MKSTVISSAICWREALLMILLSGCPFSLQGVSPANIITCVSGVVVLSPASVSADTSVPYFTALSGVTYGTW